MASEGDGMNPANIGSLRDRRRAELFSLIQQTAHRLFAERGFDAVTTEDIAAAAGVSISTYFRHAPTKEGLLVDPVRQAITEIVSSYRSWPADESAVEALIALFVSYARDAGDLKLDTWRRAIATAPYLLSKSALVSEDDQHRFIEHVASRMGVDARTDIRPALLVHTSLATVKFVFDRWLSTDPPSSPIFHVQMDQALRIALAGFR
ncbi:conserved hypothetical regulatory protein [Mycobacterium marinum M]|nr:conserved hypothetical regulatory protein [Mycobacterium marinum M]